MYKVTFYYADGREETKIMLWRQCPEARDLDVPSRGIVAFKIEQATKEEKEQASTAM